MSKTKSTDRIRLSNGDVMTLGEALDSGRVRLLQQEARGRGHRSSDVVTHYFAREVAGDGRSGDVSWEIGKTLYESRSGSDVSAPPGFRTPSPLPGHSTDRIRLQRKTTSEHHGRSPCECGSTDASWHSLDGNDTARWYCCDPCWRRSGSGMKALAAGARRENPVEDDSEIFEDKRSGNRYMAVRHKADRWSEHASWIVMRVDRNGKVHQVRTYKNSDDATLCAKEMGKGRTESDANAVVLAHRAKRATGRGIASAKKHLSSAYNKAKKHLESRRKKNPVAAEDKFYANPYGGAPGFYFSSQEEYDRKSKELYKKTGAEEWSIEFIDGPTIDAKLFGAIDDLIGQDMTVWFDEIQDKDDQFKVALYWLLTSYGERDIEKAVSDAENEVRIMEGDVEDWARDLIDNMGGPAELDEQTLQSHFDFGSYGFALRANGELPDGEYEDLDDTEAAEAYVRDYYGDNLKELPKDVLTDHFDFRDFGEDAELGGEIHELHVGGQDYVIEYTG